VTTERTTDSPDGSDSSDIDEFGYKPSLVRSPGSVHTFAAGISYISILTGTFQLFYFGLGRCPGSSSAPGSPTWLVQRHKTGVVAAHARVESVAPTTTDIALGEA
jgi:hypothetical protein